jgi:hypothetical protein
MGNRIVERAHHFLHEVQGKLPTFACSLHLFVVQLLEGCIDQLVIGQAPLGH